jgi:GcrA cell cycle regulator
MPPPLPPAPLPKTADALPDSRMLTFAEMRFRVQCKWPYGDPREPTFRYCGADCDLTEAYCAGHRSIAYQPRLGPAQNRSAA